MPSSANWESLWTACAAYDFPAVVYDYDNKREMPLQNMRNVEAHIKQQLVSDNTADVKDGLSNVLYWGHARTGYRETRVRRFRETIDASQLVEARRIFSASSDTTIKVMKLRDLELPEFGKFSFLSKVFMFLNPRRNVVLDLKLAKLRKASCHNLFHLLRLTPKATSIPVNGHTLGFYYAWCLLCGRIATKADAAAGIRAVDVERGFFRLVDEGQVEIAAQLIAQATADKPTRPPAPSAPSDLVSRIMREVNALALRDQRQVLDFVTMIDAVV